MSGDDSNKTVFKPSPLQGLKAGANPPPPKTTPSRPVKPAAPGAAEPAPRPASADAAAPRPADRSETVERSQRGAPEPVATPAAPKPKARRAQRGVSFWFSLAIAAALAAIILYFILDYSRLA